MTLVGKIFGGLSRLLERPAVPDWTPPPPRILPFRSKPGEPYRPSNGTEGRLFEDLFCSGCRLDHEAHMGDYGNGCPILARALALPIGDPEYPVEWTIHKDGYPACTAFDPDGCS